MSLVAGDRLGPYEILALIGAGGMGEVYRALDPRVGREVAIKVSAQQFNERFDREARVIAQLNHPNICTLFDVGPNYLVMELVEGEAPQGPLPLETALLYARQIADALEAAHEKGIVHRDLKPGNIKITPSGVVKVLDFGLAKTGGISAMPSEHSPTLSMSETQAGVILGTAAYMSPEQAKGKPVDKRADIFSFGVVLYEMLTGQRMFAGESLQETLAGVLKEEPKLDRVPPETRLLLSRCLEKDPRKRLRDIGDAMPLVEQAPQAPVQGRRFGKLPWAISAVLALLAAVAFWAPWKTAPPAEITRFQMNAPENTDLGIYLVLSPDGRKLAFTAQGKDGRTRIWVRDLDAVAARLLPGTEISSGFGSPFWSPDSRYIAFADGNRLKKVDAAGTTPPVTMSEVKGTVGQGSWGRDGVIVFGGRGDRSPIRRVPEAGGEAAPVTVIDAKAGETFHSFPFFLPDGRHFLYFRVAGKEHQGVYVGSLDSKPEEQSTQSLLLADFAAVYAPAPNGGEGRLLFLREGTLLAQPFDPARLTLSGSAAPVAEAVGSSNIYGYFSAAANGTLAYRTGGGQNGNQITWVDRQGKAAGTVGEPGLGNFKLSPDGTHLAASRLDNGNIDIWLVELARGITTRFTFDRAEENTPIWSSDGSRVIYRSNRASNFDLYQKAASGAGDEELLVQSAGAKWPDDTSHDGRYLLYEELGSDGKENLWTMPMQGERKPQAWLQTPFAEWGGHFSPDDRWIAYQSDESGTYEVYVRAFSPGGSGGAASAKYQVSNGGGQRPLWRKDGKELYYLGPNRTIMAVDVTSTQGFQTGAARPLFQLGSDRFLYDARGDGQQFLVPVPGGGASAPSPITIVLNWASSWKK